MKIHIEITDEQYEKLKFLRKKNLRSITFMVMRAIEQYLKRRKTK